MIKKNTTSYLNSNNALLEKLKKGIQLNQREALDLKNLPATYLICYLNTFHEAIDRLIEIKPHLKSYDKRDLQLTQRNYAYFKKSKI